MNGRQGGRPVDFSKLPECCIADIVSLTSPRDACRLSLVSSAFRLAAESDTVWERFLPPDYRSFISQSAEEWRAAASKKDIFFGLCQNPLLVDKGNKSFWLDKTSGRKCFMLSARDLKVIWGDTPRYWKWISHPEARFAEVAELISVCWLEIRGRIKTSLLSKATEYEAYLVFKTSPGMYGFHEPLSAEVGIVGSEKVCKRHVSLDTERWQRPQFGFLCRRLGRHGLFARNGHLAEQETVPSPRNDIDGRSPKERGDGWLEVELGEFFNNEQTGEVELSVSEVERLNWKGGIIVQGIEIRPKVGQ